MYRRNTSSGSNATRSWRRLATRLVGPALMSSAAERSIASSSASAGRTSPARIRPPGAAGGHPALGRVGGEVAVEEDRLARRALADEARQAQVRGAGDDALLARGEVGGPDDVGDHPGDHEQGVAGAADRERLDDADERLLAPVLEPLAGRRIGEVVAAIH